MSGRIQFDLRTIQRAIFEEELNETTWIPSLFLLQAASKRNPLIIPEDEKEIKFVDLVNLWDGYGAALDQAPRLLKADSSEKNDWVHVIAIADFDTEQGHQLLVEAAKLRAQHPAAEVLFLHNADDSNGQGGWSKRLLQIGAEQTGLSETELEHLAAMVARAADTSDSEPSTVAIREAIRTIGLQPKEQAIVLNGRLVGPIPPQHALSTNDMKTLFSYEKKKRAGPAHTALQALNLSEHVTSPLVAAKLWSLVSRSTISDIPEGIFESRSTIRMNIFEQLNSTHSCIDTGDIDTSSIQIVASIDPASELAQRWVPIINVLSELHGVNVRIFLNPKSKLEELPIKRFYRYVLQPRPTFEQDGSLSSSKAQFARVPAEALLTMGMDVPASWLVAPKISIHDLDNIKLSLLQSYDDIEAEYELEHILIEGHSRDITTGMPPRGVQLVLSTQRDPHFADTIVMANLGYFQFKANPGFFQIALQSGRSEDIFTIDSAGTLGYNPQSGDETTEIALMSFQGITLFPRLSRKAGKEEEDVLEAPLSGSVDIVSTATEIAEKLLSKVGLSGSKVGEVISKGSKIWSSYIPKSSPPTNSVQTAQADINIFSVASGHLYERMLNIMILSVMKHTKHTVKFWFIEQFLSPSFKEFLPIMAAEYGFTYEMVTYKWPHWLRGQKEKQREIWGYKILFLDVLFPLDLDKVIFVDADQIVRTDMYELVTHDLKGAPYGFTPMCDSRTEMEGFRFWKQGYWKNFLRGLPYHISALYVVDLKRFRQIAAGDRLRQQYHQLSADPNSLSNLDQDLPNNMQMMLPIHSLPQEWLWCETWCSDESLQDAKTIDLCNNPLTKEPKLDRARRQVPEWTVYDEEIAALAKRSEGEQPVQSQAKGQEETPPGSSASPKQTKDEL
jgi:UDP-glucose:glycoprotein glucosyltransferase